MPEKINAKSLRMHRLSPPHSATKRISTWAIALPRYLFQKLWNNTNGYFPYTAWNAIEPSFSNWNEASITKQWWPREGDRWGLSLLTLLEWRIKIFLTPRKMMNAQLHFWARKFEWGEWKIRHCIPNQTFVVPFWTVNRLREKEFFCVTFSPKKNLHFHFLLKNERMHFSPLR